MAKKNEINVDVTLSEKDYLYFNMFNSLKMMIGFVVYATVFLFLLSKMGYYGKTSGIAELMTYLIKPLSMFILFMGCYVGFIYYKSKRTYAKHPMVRQTHHYKITKNLIDVKTDSGEAKVKMDQLFQVMETKKMIIVYSARSRAHLITRSSFTSESAYAQMKELLRDSVPKKKLKLKKK